MIDGKFSHDNTVPPAKTRVFPLLSLQGRTAIVSGAGAGIGLAVAQALAEAGANVAIWFNSNRDAIARAKEIEEEYGVKCRAYEVNVCDADAVEKAVFAQVEEFNGRLDIFVANAGIPWTEGAIIDGTDMSGQKLQNYSYGSFIATSSMSGRIVNIPLCQAAYNSAKAGVTHLCKSLAVEWCRYARANAVCPGYVDTEIANFVPKDTKSVWKHKIPMGREAMPHELKGVYLFLASDASSYMTGADLVIDGGYSLP
ncbi:putative NADP-dependent mannitol dehydrogenase [Cyphellophora attinorum]|uniref:Putative NADP-dependent mannitol dehydrogenase n=1 Tax=Cyphellophora attinorum TaxID=1664694 RepID=A0A0N1HN13_9EURO|nr:putative NADP-dependent mannitol dehydrogenase [Phialophora attinorum]KPI36287.1 putative NADP-dependent mannitol dehydrogenase [Phialophora attinorum]